MWKCITIIFSGITIVSFGGINNNVVSAEQPTAYFTTSFYGGDIAKQKDDGKFSEDWQLKDDSFIGGLERLELRYPFKKDWVFKSEIKTLPGQEDHDITLELSKKDLFYSRIHYERFPHYYDNSGGVFKSFEIPYFVIPEEPGTDRQNMLLEFGLTLPDLPVFTFSYEKKYRDGEISSLTWGEAAEGDTNRNIVPTIKDVHDNANIFKIGAKYKHDIANIEVEQRWEFTDIKTERIERNYEDGQPNSSEAYLSDKKNFYYESSQTTVKIDKKINKKLSFFAGYRYNKIDNDAETYLRTYDSSGEVNPGGFRKNWFGPVSDSGINSHLWNFNVFGKPIKDLTVQGFLRVKNIHSDSDAMYSSDTTGDFDYSADEIHDISTRINETTVGEAIRVTYKGIRRISPYFEAAWQQGDVEIKEEEKKDGFFQRDTDADFDKQIYTVGMSFFPFKKFSGSIQYRKELTDNDYDDGLDTESSTDIVSGGYSAFINEQDYDTDIYTFRLTAHPINSVTTTFRYEYRSQDIESEMDGLDDELSHVDKQTFSGSVTLTPFSNLFLTSMAMYQDLRVKTGAKNNQAAPLRAYEADSTTFVNTAIFALNEKTDFSLDYQASFTDNYDEIDSIGLAYEQDYTMQSVTLGVKHKIRENVTLWSKCGFYDYDESHVNDIDDYTDYLFAVGAEIRWH